MVLPEQQKDSPGNTEHKHPSPLANLLISGRDKKHPPDKCSGCLLPIMANPSTGSSCSDQNALGIAKALLARKWFCHFHTNPVPTQTGNLFPSPPPLIAFLSCPPPPPFHPKLYQMNQSPSKLCFL